MITSKLPGDVQLRIAREMKDEVWKIGDLLGVIKQVEAREACEGTKLKPHLRPNTTPNPNHPTAGTFVTNGVAYNVSTVKGNTIQPHVIKYRMSRHERIFCLRAVDILTV